MIHGPNAELKTPGTKRAVAMTSLGISHPISKVPKRVPSYIPAVVATGPRASDAVREMLSKMHKQCFVHGTLADLDKEHPDGYRQSKQELSNVRFFGYIVPITSDDAAFKSAGIRTDEDSDGYFKDPDADTNTGVFHFIGYKLEYGRVQRMVYSSLTGLELKQPRFLIPHLPQQFTYKISDSHCTLSTKRIELLDPYLGRRTSSTDPKPEQLPEDVNSERYRNNALIVSVYN